MAKISCFPDKRSFDIEPSETILANLLANGIEHTHVCGGNAYCSTCRIMILDGEQNCSAPSAAERALAKKLDFPFHIRLACQTKVTGNVSIRRMVIDDEDIDILEGQLASGTANSDRHVALVFATIRGSSNFDEVNFHYDIVYIMNRYYHRIQRVVKQYGGFIPNVMGLKIMAVFGAEKNGTLAAERAVWAGLDMLEAVKELNTFLKQLSYDPLHLSIGINYGKAILVAIDPEKPDIVTPLGNVANTVSRIELANKELGSDLLVSESIYHLVKTSANINRFNTVRIGNDEFKVYEVAAMQGDRPKVSIAKESIPAPTRIMSFFQRFLSKN
ncbi:adenylate/guanylate cyclase domain-containing protein [Pseudanabaena sp. 'Roaring Creek']|uniref:adenylate/guanylate cyclase domain-containing protein n=1 Tax=Pseudanabaena sp. 'Roaring Creek' TaxID=1681830 RepID=UPI0006D77AB5|nr:adenylate/guanylate cyclase domain-containing protein [Pseudanabaena sp. 'Roaring Creek']